MNENSVELTMRIYFPFLYKKGVVNACFLIIEYSLIIIIF